MKNLLLGQSVDPDTFQPYILIYDVASGVIKDLSLEYLTVLLYHYPKTNIRKIYDRLKPSNDIIFRPEIVRWFDFDFAMNYYNEHKEFPSIPRQQLELSQISRVKKRLSKLKLPFKLYNIDKSSFSTIYSSKMGFIKTDSHMIRDIEYNLNTDEEFLEYIIPCLFANNPYNHNIYFYTFSVVGDLNYTLRVRFGVCDKPDDYLPNNL